MEDKVGRGSVWSREQDRAFEDALVEYYKEGCDDCWEKIATDVAGKSVEEVKHHYELLVDDLERIESGIVPLPSYSTSSDDSASPGGDDGSSKKGGNSRHHNSESVDGGKSSKVDQERRKGVAWSEDEHRLFLLGLEKFGKGDWRSISRNFVVTRTPTQVASHAQKYFIRLNSMNRERRRSSIHDITSVNNVDTSVPQAAITGQTNTSPAAGNSGNQNLQVSFFGGTTVGQPVGLPLVSAVGTPVNLPPPAHIAYGIRAPGQVVPGAPMNMGPTSSRR